jgi:hypothetical protein
VRSREHPPSRGQRRHGHGRAHDQREERETNGSRCSCWNRVPCTATA